MLSACAPHDCNDAPPQTAISCPVIADASPERRNAASAAISSGSIYRPIGGNRGDVRFRAGSFSMGVTVAAGAITLTVTPWAMASAAQLLANPVSAALQAAY